MTEASTKPHPGAEALDAAWRGIERAIQAFGEVVRKASSDQDPRARFEAYRAALALISDNYVAQLYADPQFPEFLPYLGLVNNYAGPTPDMTYFNVQIEPGRRYRVWGTRGTAKFIDMQQLTGWFGQDPLGGVRTMANQTFASQNIEADADGRFEFILSPTPPEDRSRPWWKLEDGVRVLLFREIFTDYATQKESAVLHFEPLDAGSPPQPWSLDQALHRMQAFGLSMEHYAFCFRMGASFAELGNNRFRTENFGGDAGQSDQLYIQARYEIPPGHALIGEWKVPETCSYWSFALYNDVYQSLDFHRRQVNLNDALAHVGEDRVFRFVLSDFDPGVANWLDVDGHPIGLLLLRAKQCKGAEQPSIRLVAATDLDRELDPRIKRIDAAERRHQLAVRRDHYLQRMRR